MTTLVRCQELRVSYPRGKGLLARGAGVRAVDGVTLSINPGETWGLVGESGSGKSSLAKALVRLVAIEGGRIWFEGKEITCAPESALRALRARMQLTLQDPLGALDPRWPVGRSIVEPLRIQHPLASRAEERVRACDLLATVGVGAELVDRFPNELSGGERQRVMLARALALKPRLLVADEPLSGLDVSTQVQMANLLIDLRKRNGLTCLIVSHDLPMLSRIADRIAVMYLGRIVETGAASTFAAGPQHPYSRTLWEAARWSCDQKSSCEPVVAPAPASGCRFHPRCVNATRECFEAEPSVSYRQDGHSVSCFHPFGSSPVPASLACQCPP